MNAKRWGTLVGLAVLMSLSAPGCGLLQDSPPTVTPILITATPDVLILPIIATETPAATAVLSAPTPGVALPTQALYRTATPTRPAPMTQTPTFTPTTTDTPVTPGAFGYVPVGSGISGSGAITTGGGGTCGVVPQGMIGTVFQSDPGIAAAIGCPLAGASSAASSAYQPFQNGVMIWVSTLGLQPQAAIYAVFNNGTYQRFNDTFQDGVDPASSGAAAPAGLLEPVRGFGKVWRDNPTVRDTLGWATAGESGGSAQVLLFERGEMVSISQAGQTYIMITGAPGTWTARSGGP